MKPQTLSFASSGIAIDAVSLILLSQAQTVNILASAMFFMSLSLLSILVILVVWDDEFSDVYSPLPILEGRKKEKMTVSKLCISLGFSFMIVGSFLLISRIGAGI